MPDSGDVVVPPEVDQVARALEVNDREKACNEEGGVSVVGARGVMKGFFE